MKYTLTGYFRHYWPWATFVLIILGLESGFTALIPFSFKYIIDDGLLIKNARNVILIFTGLGIGAILVSSLGIAKDYVFAKLSSHVIHDIRKDLFEALQKMSMRALNERGSGDIVSRFSNDLNLIEQMITLSIMLAIIPALEVIASTIFLLMLDLRLALLGIMVFPLVLLAPRKLAPKIAAESYQRKEEESFALTTMQETLSGHMVIRLFNLIQRFKNSFELINQQLKRRILKLFFLSALLERSSTFLVQAYYLLATAVGCYWVYAGQLDLGSLVSFQILFLGLSLSITYVIQYLPALIQGITGFRRISEQLMAQDEIPDDTKAVEMPKTWKAISFRDVDFEYDSNSPILRGLNFDIRQGQKTALVGHRTWEKSAIIDLLARFYAPSSGTITIQDRPINEIKLDSLYAKVGWLFPDSYLFDASISENISMGKCDASEQEIVEAAKVIGLDKEIQKLPEGYRTMVGESGKNLSGDIRQLISFARAIVRDPDIYFIDEAASSFDPATEKKVEHSLYQIAKGRTIIHFTTRFDSIKNFDIIYVLNQGRLVESGTHRQLLELNGTYKELWEKQRGIEVNEKGDYAFISLEALRNMPLFSGLSDEILTKLQKLMRTDIFAADNFVIREGEFSNLFYIIARGTVSISKLNKQGNDIKFSELSPGDYFGEIALIRNIQRTSSVKTLTPCIFLTLGRGEFLRMVREQPGLKKFIVNTAQARFNKQGPQI